MKPSKWIVNRYQKHRDKLDCAADLTGQKVTGHDATACEIKAILEYLDLQWENHGGKARERKNAMNKIISELKNIKK